MSSCPPSGILPRYPYIYAFTCTNKHTGGGDRQNGCDRLVCHGLTRPGDIYLTYTYLTLSYVTYMTDAFLCGVADCTPLTCRNET